jgi:hypothetical protein
VSSSSRPSRAEVEEREAPSSVRSTFPRCGSAW